MKLTFDQMLVIWNLKGKVRQAHQLVVQTEWKKVRIRADEGHLMFIRYDKNGPLSVTVYVDNELEFYQDDKIGSWEEPETTRKEVLNFLNTWIKERL